VTAFNPAMKDRVSGMAEQFVLRGAEAVTAGSQALGVLAGTVRREAYVMAYADCFFLLGLLLLSMVALVWLCRPGKGGALAH
jgi:DHA2 family multidrug resistance protein